MFFCCYFTFPRLFILSNQVILCIHIFLHLSVYLFGNAVFNWPIGMSSFFICVSVSDPVCDCVCMCVCLCVRMLVH